MRKENTKLKGKYKLCAFKIGTVTVNAFSFSLKIFGALGGNIVYVC